MMKKLLNNYSTCVPFIFVLTIFLCSKTDLIDLGKGLIGMGNGYWFCHQEFITFLDLLIQEQEEI